MIFSLQQVKLQFCKKKKSPFLITSIQLAIELFYILLSLKRSNIPRIQQSLEIFPRLLSGCYLYLKYQQNRLGCIVLICFGKFASIFQVYFMETYHVLIGHFTQIQHNFPAFFQQHLCYISTTTITMSLSVATLSDPTLKLSLMYYGPRRARKTL